MIYPFSWKLPQWRFCLFSFPQKTNKQNVLFHFLIRVKLNSYFKIWQFFIPILHSRMVGDNSESSQKWVSRGYRNRLHFHDHEYATEPGTSRPRRSHRIRRESAPPRPVARKERQFTNSSESLSFTEGLFRNWLRPRKNGRIGVRISKLEKKTAFRISDAIEHIRMSWNSNQCCFFHQKSHRFGSPFALQNDHWTGTMWKIERLLKFKRVYFENRLT